LLWWLLVRPQTLKRYRAAWGEKEVKKMGNRLASFLTWGPLLILALAIALYALPLPSDTLPINRYWISTGILGLMMFLTGISSTNDGENALGCVVIVASVIAISMAGGVAGGVAGDVIGSMAGGVAGGVAGDVIGSMAGVVAVVVVLIETFVAAFVVATDGIVGDVVMSNMVLIVVGVVAIVVAGGGAIELGLAVMLIMFIAQMSKSHFFATLIGSLIMGAINGIPYYWLTGVLSAPSWQQSVLSIVAFVVVSFVISGVKHVVKNGVQTGKPHWLSRTAFGALVAAYAFLIWFSFLGGWRFFQSTGG